MADSTSPSILQLVAVAVISGIISPLILQFFNRKHRQREKATDRRLEDYRRYLQSLEALAASLRNDFNEYLSVLWPGHVSRLLTGNADIDQLNRDMAQFYARVFSVSAQAKNELLALQLTCSDEVLGLVKPYLALFDSVQREAATLSVTRDNLDQLTKRFKELASQSDALHTKIMAQMRKEIAES